MSKVLMIGLDGATWRVIDQLFEDGHMPFFKSLVQSGAKGTLQSTNPPVTPVAWTTIQTGVGPGKHGVMYFQNFSRETKEMVFTDANTINVPTVHDLVSLNKKKIISINVPVTYPPKKTNGVIVSGILTPGSDAMYVSPSSLKPELDQLGSFPYGTGGENFQKDSSIKGIVSNIRSIAKQRTKIALHLMKTQPWDLFIYHFISLDALQHPVFEHLERTLPTFEEEKYQKIVPYFHDVDTRIKEMVEEAQADYVVIMSDHGFQLQKYSLNLNAWLKDKGYLSYEETLYKKVMKKAVPIAGKLLSKVKGGTSLAKGTMGKKVAQQSKIKIDWNATRAYMAGGSYEGYLYVFNENDVDTIKTELEKATNPLNGEPMIERVLTQKELYPGKQLVKDLPDLLVIPKPGYFLPHKIGGEILHEPSYGNDYQMGIHDPIGILAVNGKNITKNKEVQGHLNDILPTLLEMLGLPQYPHFDGRILSELFENGK